MRLFYKTLSIITLIANPINTFIICAIRKPNEVMIKIYSSKAQYFKKHIPIYLLLYLISFCYLNGQEISYNKKKDFLDHQKNNLKACLQQYTTISLPFVVGRYHMPVSNKNRHPYLNNNWFKGYIYFKGKKQSVQNLKYDIEEDKLIYLMTSDSYSMHCIALDENHISEFEILGKTYRYYNNLKKINKEEVDNGYYEVVYDSELKFLIHKTKERVMDQSWPFYNYKLNTDMYLIKNDVTIHIKKMKDLKNQLKEKETYIKKYIKKNKLKLSVSNYTSAPKILNYYECLLKNEKNNTTIINKSVFNNPCISSATNR